MNENNNEINYDIDQASEDIYSETFEDESSSEENSNNLQNNQIIIESESFNLQGNNNSQFKSPKIYQSKFNFIFFS